MNNMQLDDYTKLKEMAISFSKTNLIPKDYQNKPDNILVAMQWGNEIGLHPLQSLQNLSVINGRPSIWGDALLALVQNHPAYEWHKEWMEKDTAFCQVKRKGSEPSTQTFSKEDAITAGLWGRNTWKNYPKRMLQLRARGFALRDQFADALKGMHMTEELQDQENKEKEVVSSANDYLPPVIEGSVESTSDTNKYDDYLVEIESCCTIEELKDLAAELKEKGINESGTDEDQHIIAGYKNKYRQLTAKEA